MELLHEVFQDRGQARKRRERNASRQPRSWTYVMCALTGERPLGGVRREYGSGQASVATLLEIELQKSIVELYLMPG